MTSFTSNSSTTAIQTRRAPRRPMHMIWSWIIELRVRRAQFAVLSQLKDRDLRDVGLIDNDITNAKHLPLGTSATSALHGASFSRSGNW